jgi:hypothetical protein
MMMKIFEESPLALFLYSEATVESCNDCAAVRGTPWQVLATVTRHKTPTTQDPDHDGKERL